MKCACFEFTRSLHCNTSDATLRRRVDFYTFCPNIEGVLTNSANVLHPVMKGKQRCTLALVTNLAETDLININCLEALLPTVVCMQQKRKTAPRANVNFIDIQRTKVCLSPAISSPDSCLIMVWHSVTNELPKSKTKTQQASPVRLSDFETCREVLMSTSVQKIVLWARKAFQPVAASGVQCIKYAHTYNCKEYFSHNLSTPGFEVFKTKPSFIANGIHTLKCAQGGHILLSAWCDGFVDCPNDHSDEQNCSCNTEIESVKNKAMSKKVGRPSDHCSFLCYVTHCGKCVAYFWPGTMTMQHFWQTRSINHLYVCNRNHTKNDLVVDGDFKWQTSDDWHLSEEGDLIRLLAGHKSSCANSMEIPCRDGHSRCFNTSHICVFSLSGCGYLYPCRNGGHMENCKSFQCNNNFKCNNSYCIPYNKVCDSIWDCPRGEDEHFNKICGVTDSICVTMFKCRKVQTCIHLASVCDHISDCPSGDDELFCQLKNVLCPPECQCLAFGLSCFNLYTTFETFPFIAVYIFASPLVITFLNRFHGTVLLSLENCELSDMENVKFPRSLLSLTLRNNLFTTISKIHLAKKQALQMLDISWNKIECVSSDTFTFFSNLFFLNLSSNPMAELPQDTFATLTNLKLLSLVNVTLHKVDVHAFRAPELKVIESTDYLACCVNPEGSVCIAQFCPFQSCSVLVESHNAWAFFVAVFVINVVVNIACFVVHLIGMNKNNKTYTAFIVVINFTNLSLAAYLSIIWGNKTRADKDTVIKYTLWMSDSTCFAAYGFCLFYVVGSQCFIVLLSFSRFRVVVNPLETNYKSTDFVVQVIQCCTLICLIIVFAATMMLKYIDKISPTKFCVPFLNPGTVVLSVIMSWLLILAQFVSLTAVFGLHAATVVKRKESKQALTMSSNKTSTGLKIQFILLSFSVLICWLPTSIVGILTMYVQSFPLEIVAWVLATVVPLNSILVPAILMAFVLARTIRMRVKNANMASRRVVVASSLVEQSEKETEAL